MQKVLSNQQKKPHNSKELLPYEKEYKCLIKPRTRHTFKLLGDIWVGYNFADNNTLIVPPLGI